MPIHGWCGFLLLGLTIHYHLLPSNFASTTSPNSTPQPKKRTKEPLVTQTPLHKVIHHGQGPHITLRNGQTWNTLQCLNAFILVERTRVGRFCCLGGWYGRLGLYAPGSKRPWYWGWSSHPLTGNPYSRYMNPYLLGLWPLPYSMEIMAN